jgi:hypothetical protein
VYFFDELEITDEKHLVSPKRFFLVEVQILAIKKFRHYYLSIGEWGKYDYEITGLIDKRDGLMELIYMK